MMRTRAICRVVLSGITAIGIQIGAPVLAGQEPRLPDSLPPGVTPTMVVYGRTLFEGQGLCHMCHGADATGEYGPNLTTADWWHTRGSYLTILRQVLTGVSASQSVIGVGMEPRGGADVSEADVQAVSAYVWTLSHPEIGDSLPPGVTRVMVERGRDVFRGDGGCTQCHGASAPRELGPDLTDGRWLHAKGDYLTIVTRVFTGVPADRSRSGKVMPPRGGSYLSEVDVYAVAAYVWVLSRGEH